jgi:hypothetical protein
MNEATHHGIIFLPFLRIKKGCVIAGVEFLPLRDADGKVPDVLQTAVRPLTTILSGYVDMDGNAFTNCVVATIPGRGWDLPRDDFDTVRWASSLLFLASWARNEYFPTFSGPYVNSTAFRPVGQGFVGDEPTYIAVVARRRDGSTTNGGYEHGEFKFNPPLQCSLNDTITIDEPFLAALETAGAANSPVLERLRYALPYVSLANTDDDLMDQRAEAILIGSAFEQALGGPGNAYGLGRKFGALFKACGSVTVEDAKKARPGIEIDTSKPEYAAAQPKWWVHRKWLEELYDVRSKAVHKGHHQERSWGWSIAEHLVMAAYVFPLTVKSLLEREGHYTFGDNDRLRCRTIDKLLSATDWAKPVRRQIRTWNSIIADLRSEVSGLY